MVVLTRFENACVEVVLAMLFQVKPPSVEDSQNRIEPLLPLSVITPLFTPVHTADDAGASDPPREVVVTLTAATEE
jgi:hypothetical protein